MFFLCYDSGSTSLSLSNVPFDVLLFSRVSNNEKKLEAVRSGVRAISVSGKMEIMDVFSHGATGSGVLYLSSFQQLSFSLCLSLSSNSCFFYVSLFSPLSGLPFPLRLSPSSHPLCCLLFTSPPVSLSHRPSVLASIHVVSFPFKLWSPLPPDWLQT